MDEDGEEEVLRFPVHERAFNGDVKGLSLLLKARRDVAEKDVHGRS